MRNTLHLLIFLFLFANGNGQAPDSLSLESCIRTASHRSRLNREIILTNDALANKIKNLGTNWYPTISLNGQALYNSETVDFSDAMQNLPVSIPSLPLDQYKVWADLNQQIYDGGMIKAQKYIERSSSAADIHRVESELLGIRQQVNRAYFSLLLTRKSTEVIRVSLKDLGERKKTIKAGVDNGTLLLENMQSIEAEELLLKQKLVELELSGNQLIHVLSILMDTTLSPDFRPIMPVEPAPSGTDIRRPEYQVFEMQKERLSASQKLVTATDMPKLFAFSQGAYGRPGYNFLNSDFHTFYSVGLGMKWNLLNYGDSRRQKKVFEIQKEIIDVKKKTFDDQLAIQLAEEKNNLAKYEELLKQDEAILKLRKAIAATSFVKLENGTITSTEYFSETNNELLARLQFENHKILKLQAAYNYLLLQGKL